MNTFKKIVLGLSFAILALGLVGFSKVSAFTANQMSLAFKVGDLQTITLTVAGGPTVTFTGGMDYATLIRDRTSLPPYFDYSYSGTPLCTPDSSSPSYNPQFPKSTLRVSFTNVPASGPVAASVYALVYSGTTATNCNIVSPDSGTVGFTRSVTYTPAVPITGQGSQFTDSSFAGASFEFLDGATIRGTLQNKGTGTTPVDFKDADPVDNNRQFVSGTDAFCPPNTRAPGNKGIVSFLNPSQEANPITLGAGSSDVTLWYYNAAGKCVPTGALTFPIPNSNLTATKVLTWNTSGSDEIDSIGTTDHTFKPQTTTSGPSKTAYVTEKGCSGYAVVLSSDNAGILYDLGGSGKTFSGCSASSRSVLIAGVRGQATNTTGCADGSTPDPKTGLCADGSTPGGTAPNSCESGYTGAAHEFNWISCKILAGLDGLTTTFLGIVQDQLDVCTGKSSTTGNTCSNNILTDQVKQAWRIFRVIATSILVIILLVMVISQAIGSGPFDAYTLRKVLPRLVAIAIFMQISWYVFKFVIDVSNDVGVGIARLMYFPFGGAGKMTLDNLIGGVGVLAPNFTVATLFTGIVVGYIAGGLTIFGVIFLGASAVASLIVGLLVLLFRQILIIMLMIFVPVALVAWILPGTQRYWKLWQDNFIKILFMFPLITAMIAGGRIFAFVGSTKGVLGLFIVILGFFGPLWFLPKTFKWGGQAFGALSTGTLAATRSARGYPGKYALQGAKANRDFRSHARAERLATTEPGNRRMLDRVLAGEFNVTRARGAARRREFDKTLAEGDKAARENVAAQLLGVGYENMRHGPAVNAQGRRILPGQAGYQINKLDALQAWLEGREYAGVTPDEALMGHAFDELAKLGDPDRIRAARRNSHGHEAMWTKAMARNFPRMNEIARDFTLAPDLTNLSPRQYSTQDADTADELFRQVDQGYIMDRETGQQTWLPPQERQAQRQRAVAFADEVFNNELIYGDLGPDHRRVIDQLRTMRDPNDIAVVQGARRRGGGGAPTRAVLPEGQVLAAQPQAQANLTQALADPARSPTVAAEFARQLDDPAQRPAYEQFLRARVQAHNTPAAVAMNTLLEQAHRRHIDQQMEAYEQSLLAQGMQPAAVQNLVTTARQRADQDHHALFP